MPSLKKLLTIKNNNYTKLAKIFKERTGLDIIHSGYTKKVPLSKSCSIIIPFYNKNYSFLKRNLISILHQDLPINFKKNKVEIILINDGSSVDLKKFIRPLQKFYFIIYLKLKKNYGAAVARNLGLLYARNEIIIFLDADVVLPKDFVATHLLRHEFLDNCIIAGCRQKINLRNLSWQRKNLKEDMARPDYKEDFRYKKFIPLEWKKIHKSVPSENFNRTYYLFKESDYFKQFGKGKIIGVWDLPFMFVGGNASVLRRYVLEVGGFDHRFKGRELEDTHLGAKLIARGLYLIPNLHATVYHLQELKGKDEEKIRQFKKNLKLYNKLKDEELFFLKERGVKEKMRQYFKNKFKVNYF